MEDEPVAQRPGHPGIRVEHGAEEAAVGARHVLVEAAEEAEREDRLAGPPRLGAGRSRSVYQ